ncbi:MAG TPA: hypothetical protein VNX87_26460, partial [Candidatus Sulfotelmatobacter sp.]|nr:hypothetical protein [Candidatus Sulfotelmatobacter sp.]
DREGRSDRFLQPAGNAQRVARIAHGFQQDREFIGSQAEQRRVAGCGAIPRGRIILPQFTESRRAISVRM